MNKKIISVLVTANLLNPVFVTSKLAVANNKFSSTKDITSSKEIIINSEEIEYDRDNNLVVAKGNVELITDEHILIADEILYYKDSNAAEAYGNVSVLDKMGNVAFAEKLVLTDNMTKGLIKAFSIRMQNDAVFAANEALKLDEDNIILNKAVYSACKIKGDYPLWQIKSQETAIDQTKEQVSHKNAKLEVYGIPVLYTPYFAHPTPKAKRKSGVLIPKYYRNSDFGTAVEIPYYYNIAPNLDTTIGLKFYSHQRPMMHNEVRYMTENSYSNIRYSVTHPKHEAGLPKRNFKGHIFSNTTYKLPENWNLALNIKKAHDKTYLRRYDINRTDYYLASTLDIDKYNSREDYLLKNMVFQDLRAEDNDMPKVLPYGNYNFVSERGDKLNEQVSFNLNVLNLIRKNETNVRRMSSSASLEVPYITDNGHVFDWKNSIRLDFYNVDRVNSNRILPGSNQNYSGVYKRALPKSSLKWQYPFSDGTSTIAPIATLTAAPNRGNSLKIPNEDSNNPEITDNNVFKDNKYAGLDYVETGIRASYGLNYETRLYDKYLNLLIAQEFKNRKDVYLPEVSGFNEKRSDYVGHVLFNPADTIDIYYKFRFDSHNYAWHRNEAGTKIRINNDFNLKLSYHASDLKDEKILRKQKSMVAETNYRFRNGLNLSLNGSKILTSRKISPDHGMIDAGINLRYEHQCIDAEIGFKRNFTRDRDVKPDKVYMLRLSLKTLN